MGTHFVEYTELSRKCWIHTGLDHDRRDQRSEEMLQTDATAQDEKLYVALKFEHKLMCVSSIDK